MRELKWFAGSAASIVLAGLLGLLVGLAGDAEAPAGRTGGWVEPPVVTPVLTMEEAAALKSLDWFGEKQPDQPVEDLDTVAAEQITGLFERDGAWRVSVGAPGQPVRTAGLGDVILDGWTVTAIDGVSVGLEKEGEARVVNVFTP